MRGNDSGLAHGTKGSPQTTLEQEEYAAKVNENEERLLEDVLSAIPTFDSVNINTYGKLAGYALNPNHPIGKHKARVFNAALGFTQADAYNLESQIREKAPRCKPIKGKRDNYGQRWTLLIPIKGNNNHVAIVETAWIVRPSNPIPDLVTAFVAKENKHA